MLPIERWSPSPTSVIEILTSLVDGRWEVDDENVNTSTGRAHRTLQAWRRKVDFSQDVVTTVKRGTEPLLGRVRRLAATSGLPRQR